jgi:hypothetical protein
MRVVDDTGASRVTHQFEYFACFDGAPLIAVAQLSRLVR